MDPVMLGEVLRHYKRKDVQEEIVRLAQNKEAVGSFGGSGYAKRPDVLVYPNDIIEQVKNGVTSFHISEESWSNPQHIDTSMRKQDYDALRTGWDLVLDIDCPYWEFAKITSWLFIKSLKEHGIEAVSSKFSGNKGFHIAVPFEAFPEKVNETLTKDLFPEGPRKIALYLLDYISTRHITVDDNKIVFGNKFSYTIQEIETKTGKPFHELIQTKCERCGKTINTSAKTQVQFTCMRCDSRITGEEGDQYKSCPKCNILMERTVIGRSKACCSNPLLTKVFNPLLIVDVDTILIAPRHLYRAAYSYNEKSGLISVPIDTNRILDFEKSEAKPQNINVGAYGFLDRNCKKGQAKRLLVEALDFSAQKEHENKVQEEVYSTERKRLQTEFENVQSAIPESFFPPCIQIISRGMKDGRKRSVFIMINFLSSCGWDYDQIEEWLKKWNKNNNEPLKEQQYTGQIRYAKQSQKKILPPNCDNQAYYKSFGVCQPDSFCSYIKNPANYAIKKARASEKMKKGERKKRKTSKDEAADGGNSGPKRTAPS